MTAPTNAHASLSLTTDVLIVGAGPTGLALAICLQQAGIKHLIVDKLPEGLNTSRAAVIHVHTLETLERLGVAKELAASGVRVAHFRIRDRDRSLLNIRFDQLGSAYPYLLMLPQNETERILRERLTALGGEVHRGVTVKAVQQHDAGASVTLAGPLGEAVATARYVVGADGMNSTVRAASGIGFEGGTYEDSFILADVMMDWSLGASEVSLFFSAEGLVVVAPLPGGQFRVVASTDNAPEHPTVEFVQKLLEARGPRKGPARVSSVIWSSRFRIHHRLARSYRSGSLLLMGDAAHVHSPAGGQGMNTGLVDAVVLGRLLSCAIGTGNHSLLNDYEKIRRPAARQVLDLAGRLTSMATVQGRFRQSVRNLLLTLIDAFPPVRHQVSMNLSGLSRSRLAELPGINSGEMMYDLRLKTVKGER